MGLSGSRSKTHQDLHVVVGVDEPGHVGWTLQDEHGAGIPQGASQLHLHSHRPGPAGKQTPAGMRGWAGPDGEGPARTRPGVREQLLPYYLLGCGPEGWAWK